MRRYPKIKFFFICTFLVAELFGQRSKTDSLFRVLRTAKEDTAKVSALMSLAWSLKNKDPDTSITIASQALSLSEKLKFVFGAGKANHGLGTFYKLKSNYPLSLNYNFKALAIWEKLEKEVKKNLKYSVIRSKSTSLGNIGIVYVEMGDDSTALNYYLKALRLDDSLGNKSGIARHLGNIGQIYQLRRDNEKALKYYKKALILCEELKSKNGIATNLGNIGIVYYTQKNYLEAILYFSRALKIEEELGNNYNAARHLGNMGVLYGQTKKYKNAHDFLDRSIALYRQLGAADGIRDFEKAYYEMDSIHGDFKSAIEHYINYIAARDSITNEENIKKQVQVEMQFEFDKKQVADSVKVWEEKKVVAAEFIVERNKSYSLYGGLALVLIFTGFMYSRFRFTQKQNEIIEKQKLIVEDQKKIVEEKNKAVMDSINYASRIQHSLLPTEKYIDRNLRGRV